VQQNHSLGQQSFTFRSYCSFESLQQTAVRWRVYSSAVFLKLNKQYASHVPEHNSHHFVRWRHNLELDRSRRFFVFPLPWSLLSLRLIVMNPGLVPVTILSSIASPSADFQGMSSLAGPAVLASAVLAPIEQTPSETWDDCGRFCAPKPVKCQCAEQCLKLTRASRTVRKHQLPQLWHQSSQQHAGQARSFLIYNAFSAASKLRTPNVYCGSRETLVAINWTHLGVNLSCIKSFCP